MKKYALPLALTSLLVLQACNEQTATTEVTAVDPSAAAALDLSRAGQGIRRKDGRDGRGRPELCPNDKGAADCLRIFEEHNFDGD